jgi:hypothetical protein
VSDWLDQWIDSEEEAAEVEELPWQITGRTQEEREVMKAIDAAAAESLGVSLAEVRRRLLVVHEERRRGR